MDITGFADGPPVKVGTSIADLVAGISAAHGVVLALLARSRTRRGQKVEISMLDAMAALLTYQAGIYFATGQRPTRRGNAHPSIVPYEVFTASDGFIALGVANDSLWQRCCTALERSDLITDPLYDTVAKRVENRDVLIPLLNEIMAARPAAEWLARFEGVGVPAGRIKSVPDVCESPHLRARGMIATLPHPAAGQVTVMGIPVQLHSTPGALRQAPPRLGEHTNEILRRLARVPARQIAQLRERGVV
jgi:crotonobetainyl-CoA:carnitine CoA-transferase CaiB-like acyl-CoA transferase